MLDGTEYFECQCFSPEHSLRFVLDLDEGDPGIHTEVYLGSYPWGWKRVWVGVRYIFGYKSRYGAWDCFLLQPADAVRLASLCDRLVKHTEALPPTVSGDA
jgi:hypothetical protein